MKTEVPDGIEGRFLKMPYRQFIQEYEIHLSEFMEYRRIFSEEEEEPIELEKKFLRLSLNFLRERNEEVLSLDSQTINSFSKSKGINNDELFYREDLRAEFEEWDRKNNEIGEMEECELASYNYKIHFLSLKAKRLGVVDITWGERIIFNENHTEFDKIEPLSAKGREKLIYLNELGILDFIQKKNPEVAISTIASLLVTLTEESYGALQPPLSAIIKEGDNPVSNNNPYTAKKTAPKVKENLARLGFKTMKK